VGEPEDVARVLALLVDPANDWITGQVFSVDGGLGSVKRASS
jgi:NAD(P)-dependent dehydrogenase (short-subunit alcohol dehydrogenase family)